MTTGDHQAGNTATKRKKLSVRISVRGYALITERAAAADVTPSHMVRRMLAFAADNMPTGYVPGRGQRRRRPA